MANMYNKGECNSNMPRITIQEIKNQMTRSLIYGLVDLLNRLPSKDRVPDTLSPPTVVKEIPNVDMVHKYRAF